MRHAPRRAFIVSKPFRRPAPSDALPAEIAFLRPLISDTNRLDDAAQLSRRQGTCAAKTLIAEGFVGETLYYLGLSRHLGLPFVDNRPMPVAPVDPAAIVATSRVRIDTRAGAPWLCAPEGRELRVLIAARDAGLPLPKIAITTPTHLRTFAQRHGALPIAYCGSEALPDGAPALSAKRALNRRGRIALLLLPIAAALGLFLGPPGVQDVFGTIFFASMALRLLVCAGGVQATAPVDTPLSDADLPTYSILVPLHREETDVVEGLVAALRRLDYPRAKLEVLFLVEPEDSATIRALESLSLPPWSRILVGPRDDGRLRTKPRALNIGLLFARGTYLTVYDAEDRPEPDQLRLAAARFATTPDDVACLQARLAISNGDSKLIARLFAIEYAALFDLFNIGIAALGLPMALGGTSNHFRVAALRAVGGWDAWNVTEDADLGLRLARFGYAVAALSSTTFEEAPETFINWLNQRRRWTKGWMQTLLVLALDVRAARRRFGTGRSILLALLLTNLVTGPLLLPLFSFCVVVHLVLGGLPDTRSPWQLVETTLAASVICLGISSTLWPGWIGGRRRRVRGLALGVSLLLPYQLLISFAAWAGLVDLIRKPFHWHKTAHGRAARRRG